jgi:hypothetical protein
VKVTAIKLLHDFQGLHLKRRHFEHKSYNKHSQTWKLMFSTTWRTLFQTLSPWNLILSKTSFSHLKNLQHFEQIFFTPPTHLERLLLSLQPCKLKAFSQMDSPFLCCTSKHFQKLKDKFSTLEKLTTLWTNLFHTSHSLGKTITLFTTLQTQKLKQNPMWYARAWVVLNATRGNINCLVVATCLQY